jgi:hypothetical protein
MNVSPTEAEEALVVIENMARKTRHSIASGGTTITLIITGIIWLIGFTATQFLENEIVTYIWAGLVVLGTLLGFFLGSRRSKRVRSPMTAPMVKRVGLFWLLLILYGIAAIAVAQPTDGKQATMIIILFILLGQMSMGLLFSFASVWWTLPITILALIGYFFFIDNLLSLDGSPGWR